MVAYAGDETAEYGRLYARVQAHLLADYALQQGGHALALFVVAVWVVQLLWSGWWMARCRFGPLEWLWRTATYRRRQPLRRAG